MAETPRHLPPKKEVALALLEGDSVFIHLDPRAEGVLVPRTYAKHPQLVLQVGLQLAIRIPDLTIDDDGISCTLSFNRSPFWCRMPWPSIYALVGPDGRGMLWPEDVPPEVAEQMKSGRAGRGAGPEAARAREAEDDAGRAATGKPASKRPRRKAAKPAADEEQAAPPRGAARPTLAAVPSPRAPAPAEPHSGGVGRGHAPRRAPDGAASGGGAPPAGPAPDRARQEPPLGAHVSAPRRQPGAPLGPSTAARKPRRELPPYLRVVK